LIGTSGYLRLDARMTLETSDGQWAVDLIGKNLTDRVIVTSNPLELGAFQATKEQPPESRRSIPVPFWGGKDGTSTSEANLENIVAVRYWRGPFLVSKVTEARDWKRQPFADRDPLGGFGQPLQCAAGVSPSPARTPTLAESKRFIGAT